MKFQQCNRIVTDMTLPRLGLGSYRELTYCIIIPWEEGDIGRSQSQVTERDTQFSWQTTYHKN